MKPLASDSTVHHSPGIPPHGNGMGMRTNDTPPPLSGSKSFVAGPLTEAVSEGRWLEARRRLQSLEGAHGSAAGLRFMPEEMLLRIRRIGQVFDESLQELNSHRDREWMINRDLDRGFAFRLDSDRVRVVSTRKFDGIDALHAFVGLCEFELCGNYLRGVRGKPKLLHGDTDGDSLWHVFKSSAQGKEDNILQVTCVDALDEDLKSLWVSAYVPPEFEERPRGAEPRVPDPSLPPPQEGAVRLGYWRSVFAIKPLGVASAGFEMTFALSRRPTSAACVFPNFMEKEVEAFWTNFRNHLKSCQELNRREFFSPNAKLYDAVRRRLLERS